MKVQLDPEDMAGILREMKGDIGARLAAIRAERETNKLPWVASGTYTDNILEAIASYYQSKGKAEK